MVYLTLIYVVMLVRARPEVRAAPTEEIASTVFLVAFMLGKSFITCTCDTCDTCECHSHYLSVAHKFLNDDQYQNGTWPSLSGYSGRHLLDLEFEYMKSLNYTLFVKDADFLSWSTLLDECFSNRHNDRLVIGQLRTLEQKIGLPKDQGNDTKCWKEADEREEIRRLDEERARARRMAEMTERVRREAVEQARWKAQEERENRRQERNQRETGQANIKAIFRLLEVSTEKEKIRQQLRMIEAEEQLRKIEAEQQLRKIEAEERRDS